MLLCFNNATTLGSVHTSFQGVHLEPCMYKKAYIDYLSKEDTKKLINKMMRHAYGFDNSQDYPRCEHFILFVDGKPVSMGCLMLEMTDYWRKHRGYFWYKTSIIFRVLLVLWKNVACFYKKNTVKI